MCGHSASHGGSKFWMLGMTMTDESHVLDHVVRISSGDPRGLIFGWPRAESPPAAGPPGQSSRLLNRPLCLAQLGLHGTPFFTDSQAAFFHRWGVTLGSAPLWLVHHPCGRFTSLCDSSRGHPC